MLPEAERALARVRAVLAAHPETRMLAKARLERLSGSTDGRAWRATLDLERWFVRCELRDMRPLGADPENEARMLSLAGEAGIAPRLVYAAPEDGLLVTRYVDGRGWGEEDYRDAVSLSRLGAQLARLHALPATHASLRRVDFAAQARLLEARVRAAGREVPDEMRRWADEAAQKLSARPRPQVPCHNDLHPRNVLADADRPMLVDWEYAGVGDPLYDLVPVWMGAGAQADLLAAFGTGYGGRTAGEAFELIEEATRLYEYVRWLWYQAHEVVGEGG